MGRPKTARGEHFDSPLARSLRLLIEAQAEGSVNAWVARFDGALNQTTINRISNGTSDASISVLQHIAKATRYAAWQLLHPDFHPRTMPPLGDKHTMRVAAIYAGIKDERDRKKALAILEQFEDDDVSPAATQTTRRRAHSP